MVLLARLLLAIRHQLTSFHALYLEAALATGLPGVAAGSDGERCWCLVCLSVVPLASDGFPGNYCEPDPFDSLGGERVYQIGELQSALVRWCYC
jgi:hypothetical protein